MKDWEAIRKARPDITDHLIHWVRPKRDGGEYKRPLEILVDIIESGYLKPTFATRTSIYDSSRRPTIKGPYPAVCFTEQSLDCFLKSCQVLPRHYYPYGVALNKRALYQYGGRPIIYGPEEMLGIRLSPSADGYESGKDIFKDGLPKEYQYLWMRYQPIPNQDGYVVDWTHEREWRCLVASHHDSKFGDTPGEGIPLLLPGVYNHELKKTIYYLPKILVRSEDDKKSIEQIIETLVPGWVASCQSDYLKNCFEQLPGVNIIALSELGGNSEAIKLEWNLVE